MNRMRPWAHFTLLGSAVVATVFVAACSAPTGDEDKAGGSGEPVVLQMANPYGDLAELVPQVGYFVDRVEQLSGGEIKVNVLDQYGHFANDAEQRVVRDTATNKVDLGWVGTRTFDTMGVTSMQALSAPMLIDSYDLEAAVIRSGMTTQMLPALDEVGVVGLGILADGLRKPMGTRGPIVGVDDWRGIAFSTFPSQGQAEAIRALGAKPAQLYAKARDVAADEGAIQGFEMGMFLARGRGQLYATLNLSLWPQMDVLIANPAKLDSLTEDQRAWLNEAAQDAARKSATISKTDEQSVHEACEAGMRFATASPEQLTELRRRFDPVYADLEKNTQTKGFITQIESLKESTPPDPTLVIPTDCAGDPPSKPVSHSGTTPAYLNGVYRWTITREDAAAAGSPDDTDYPGTTTVSMKDGDWKASPNGDGNAQGTYWVKGHRISFAWPAYDNVNTFTFVRHGTGDLTLEPVLPMDHGDAVLWSAVPWTKIS